MYPSQQDELASLFAQRMTFAPQSGAVLQAQVISDEKQAEPAFVSISAHYTHTTHIRPGEPTLEPSRSPPPSYNESMMPEAMAQVFLRNSIDPSSLLPNQIELFRNAQDEQRLRLIELWRISPPSYLPKEEHVYASWAPTSMRQEEQMAKVRLETRTALRVHQAYHASVQTSYPMAALSDFDTHVDQNNGHAMGARSVDPHTLDRPSSEAEPYMVSGYQNSSRSDPAYAASPALWQSPSYAHARRQESMEDQYGSMMQIRNHADWEASNRQLANEQMVAGAHASMSHDEDMEL